MMFFIPQLTRYDVFYTSKCMTRNHSVFDTHFRTVIVPVLTIYELKEVHFRYLCPLVLLKAV